MSVGYTFEEIEAVLSAIPGINDEPAPAGAKDASAFQMPTTLKQGERHATLFKLLRSQKARGISLDAALATCHIENERAEQPLGRDDLDGYLRRAWGQADQPAFDHRASHEVGLDKQKGRLKHLERMRREVRRELDAEERGQAAPLDFRTEDDLLQETPAPELIQGLLIQGSLFMLFGPKNLGKTFLTIALAYAVATDQPTFLGVPVKQHGDVVLVLAEGGSRLGLRLRAWRQAHGFDRSTTRLHVLKRAVDLTDVEAIDRFIAQIREWNPVLVIFDTLSRCMPGAVENAAEDMSTAVANCDRIRGAIPGATIGVIHHPTKANDDVERGAGTFANAIDTVINARDEDGVLTLSCKYTRDLDPFAPIQYTLEPWVIEDLANEQGNPYTSAVVRRLSEEGVARAKEEAASVEQRILALLQERGATSGSDLTAALKVRKETVLAACRRLKADQRLNQVGPKNRPQWELAKAKLLRLVDPEPPKPPEGVFDPAAEQRHDAWVARQQPKEERDAPPF